MMQYLIYVLLISFLFCHAQNETPISACEQQKHVSVPKKNHKKNDETRHFIKKWGNPDITPSPPPPLMGKQMSKVATRGIAPLSYEFDGNVKVFRLIAHPIEKIITDGQATPSWEHLIPKENTKGFTMHHKNVFKTVRCWGYNGSMQGPTIECTEGDRIRIIVKNELPEPTSVHWHGILLPNGQDGAPPATQKPIMPGETFTYEFTLYQSGTYLYHSGFNIMKQDQMGLVGLLVIHPKKYDDRIDRDYAIMLHSFAIPPGSEYIDLTTMDFNWFTFNGFAAPLIPHMFAKQGERVRIRLGNMSMDSHPIHVHGHVWTEVGTEGGPIQKSAQRKGATINVPPGSTRDVEFIAWNPGLWRYHCHKIHHVVNAHADVPMGLMTHGGMFTMFYVEPKDPQAPWQPPTKAEA